MKMPDEVKAGLRHCHTEYTCDNCPHRDHCNSDIAEEIISYIEQLEERIDLMLIQMRGDCGTCKHKEERGQICYDCLEKAQSNKTNWEYEGLPEVGR